MTAAIISVVCTFALAALGLFLGLHDKVAKKHQWLVWVFFVVVGSLGTASALYQGWQASVEAEGLATGGDSYAYLDPQIDDGHNSAVSLVVMNQGNYALRSLNVRIVRIDAAGRDSIAPRTVADPFQNDLIFPMDAVGKHQASFIQLPGPIPLEGDHVKWNVFFTALNGSWDDLVRLHRVNGHWVKAFKVIWKGADGMQRHEVYQQVDPTFPTPVVWD
ncbi:MAG TPA: hypothetical protein VJN96_12850 [Vicinamibacterales bacterium]|nr:hypothetical protein [Vicinamibacterales bacterium]